jgi:hypothetical protein
MTPKSGNALDEPTPTLRCTPLAFALDEPAPKARTLLR